ncbi:MAG: hypothetical protein Q7T54_06170 [Candidatus Levybacteria bacterium]|nr:hypothetical protein [Candidatus Levybacteria bacterium]
MKEAVEKHVDPSIRGTEAFIPPSEITITKIRPSKLNTAIKGTATRGAGFVMLGMAVYGGVEMINDFVVPPIADYLNMQLNYDDPRNFEYDRETGLDGLLQGYKELYGERLTVGQIQILLNNDYEIARDSLSKFIGYEVRTQYDAQTKDFVARQRQFLVLDGVKMLQTYFGMSEIALDEDKGLVRLPSTNRNLSVKDPYDLILIDQYTTRVMSLSTGPTEEERSKSKQSVEDIVWLMNNENLDVTLEGDSAFVFQDNSLELISRLGQIMEQNSITEFPPIRIVPYLGTEAAGYYVRSVIGKNDEEIISVNKDAGHIIAHEFGHYISLSTSDHTLAKFNSVVNAKKEELHKKGFDNSGKTAFVSDYAHTNSREDYAETFSRYYIDGTSFRNTLKYLAAESPTDYQVLLAKYDYMKRFFGGKEYLSNGVEFKPQVGESYLISDAAVDNDSIALRSVPETAKNANGQLRSGSRVRIVGEPVESDYPLFFEKKRFYPVQVNEGDKLITGWVADIWFGAKIESMVDNK